MAMKKLAMAASASMGFRFQSVPAFAYDNRFRETGANS